MNCQEVQALLPAYLEDEVTPQERALIQNHLATCEACQKERAALSATRNGVRQALKRLADRAEPSAQAWTQLQARLVQQPTRSRAWRSLDVMRTSVGEMTMQKKLKIVLSAALITLVLGALFLLRGVTPVSAQQILDRAYTRLGETQAQGIQHLRIEHYQNFEALPGTTKKPPTLKHLTESYRNAQTSQYRNVVTDTSSGLLVEVSGFDGANVYASAVSEMGQASSPLTVYRSVAPRGWKDIYGDTSNQPIDAKAVYDDMRSDPNVKLVGQETWSDGRSVFVLRSSQVDKLRVFAGQPVSGFSTLYFDATTYELVEQKMSIEQDSQEIVITDYRQLVNEILPAATPISWDLSDLKDIRLVDDPTGERTGPWMEAVSRQELASRIKAAYLLQAVPEGFTELISVPVNPDQEPSFYAVDYRDQAGGYFRLDKTEPPQGLTENTAEVYKTKNGLTLRFMDQRAASTQVQTITSAVVEAPNNTFMVTSNLPRDRVKALAETLVLAQ
jgi:hypothetical protein